MGRRAAIVLTVAAVAASASACPVQAEAAGWPVAIASAGFCVPKPEDSTAVPQRVGALALGQPSTKPVAILDTGVDPASPDLAGRVLQGIDATTGGPASGDADGHGTQLAGLAAGSGVGVLGASPRSQILPIRVFGPDRSTTGDDVVKGLNLAVQRGAGVILLGGSATATDTSPQSLAQVRQAIDAAFAAGVLVVAAAGDAANAAATVPGGLPHVLEIGGANGQNLRSATSNFGPWLDLVAPGDGISAPQPTALCNYGYGFSSGSDFAAATVAGATAAIQALRPALTTQQLFELVRRAGVDLGPTGRDDDSGFGFFDASKANTVQPQSKETSTEVDDDPFWVRGKYAKAHPALITSKKLRLKAVGTVSATKDPADVYPVRLAKNQRMVVTLNATKPGDLLGLSILRASAGDFDLTNDVSSNIAIASDGLSDSTRLEVTAKKASAFYIAVTPADAVDPEDPTLVAPPLVPYQLSAFSQIKKAKAKK